MRNDCDVKRVQRGAYVCVCVGREKQHNNSGNERGVQLLAAESTVHTRNGLPSQRRRRACVLMEALLESSTPAARRWKQIKEPFLSSRLIPLPCFLFTAATVSLCH